jgi:methanogenic corrinoid protein MtbC1
VTGPVAALADAYLGALLTSDRREALRLLMDEGLAAGVSVPVLLTDVIRRAQHEIGRLWQENRITVADEHLATAISQFTMARLFQEAARAPARRRTLALACVEGELHDMGVRVAADLLEIEGFAVQCFGANVPTESLVVRVRNSRPDALLLSATMAFNLPALRGAAAALRTAIPDMPVLVGGHAFSWSPRAADTVERTAAEGETEALIRDVERILAR